MGRDQPGDRRRNLSGGQNLIRPGRSQCRGRHSIDDGARAILHDGAAARAAMPYLQDALAKNAVIDLKPFAADARAKIAAAAADFRQVAPGVSVDTAVTDLRLTGIEFDSKTLRIVTETQGTAKVTVTELPK